MNDNIIVLYDAICQQNLSAADILLSINISSDLIVLKNGINGKFWEVPVPVFNCLSEESIRTFVETLFNG